MHFKEFTQKVIARIKSKGIAYDDQTITSVVFETIEEYEDLANMYNDALLETDFIDANAQIEQSLREIMPELAS